MGSKGSLRESRLIWVGALLAGSLCVSEAALTELEISYYTDYAVSLQVPTISGQVSTYASAFSATRIGGDPLPAGHSDPFLTFCLDVRYFLATPAHYQSGNFPNPYVGEGDLPMWVSDGIYKAAQLYNTIGTGLSFGGSHADEGAALQLAIWEVLYESSGTYSLSSGEFQALSGDSHVLALAESYLGGVTADYNLTSTFWQAQGAHQSLIGPLMPVPEPTTYVAATLLCIPFLVNALRVFRRSRRS